MHSLTPQDESVFGVLWVAYLISSNLAHTPKSSQLKASQWNKRSEGGRSGERWNTETCQEVCEFESSLLLPPSAALRSRLQSKRRLLLVSPLLSFFFFFTFFFMKDKIAINYVVIHTHTHTHCYYRAAFHSAGMSFCRYTTCVSRCVSLFVEHLQ